ncbi:MULTISPECIES: hypothetical protein [unclassified Acinetobacter]|uniref:hypothetical protein n=1 Tax=Acinetobacter TaxID=469 RepID=UPI00157B1EEC|nr:MULTISPECIES: hypothetical protein [unclassified Acinetobacter]MDM1757913.1 hypothetical protein [Acinetobacter sp. 256-1]MDM1761328.1 hypothetical protein [Acinetobacter sp. 251-1]
MDKITSPVACYQATILLLSCLASMYSYAEDGNSAKTTTSSIYIPSPQLESDFNILEYVPKLLDMTPTVLPAQSDEVTVPPTEDTENATWIDQKQKGIRNWADRTANHMNHWFGETDPAEPASATLRILLDNRWNEHDGYDVKPRIRGKIKLPALENRLSLVFGDDALDNEINNNIAITNENPNGNPDKSIDGKRIRDDNSSIALRWSQLSKRLPFDVDADLGIRSGDDVYARLKAEKDWKLEHDFTFHAEQIYRYGIDSENYLRTNLELTHARPNQAFLSNQFNLTYADEQDDDLTWDNRLYRQHQFFKGNRFNYGIYTGGFYNNDDLRLNSWGPFVSWRQPLWREWFYVQGDLNYFNDHREDKSHYPSALVRLEALF